MTFKFGKNPFKTTKNPHSQFYVEELFENVKNNLDARFFHPNAKIHNMVHTTSEMTFLYSDEGTYITQGDIVFRITYNDGVVKKCNVELENGVILKGTLDYSRENRSVKTNQIPYNNFSVLITRHTYTFSKSSDVTLVLLMNGETLHDIYFELKDNIEHSFIKQHIGSLLSCIN